MATILLVDDDIYHARRLRDALEEEGFEVVHRSDATSGLQAYEGGGAEGFAAILLDVAMPTGAKFGAIEARGGFHAGLSLARAIIRKDPTAPIIGITGLMEEAVRNWFSSRRLPVLDKRSLTPKRLLDYITMRPLSYAARPRICFIVHGQDTDVVDDLKAFITSELDGCRAVVLAEERSGGKTVIEKFEEYAEDAFVALAVLTPDDEVIARRGGSPTFRARQNVIFELGYFIGRRGRLDGKVIILSKGMWRFHQILQELCASTFPRCQRSRR